MIDETKKYLIAELRNKQKVTTCDNIKIIQKPTLYNNKNTPSYSLMRNTHPLPGSLKITQFLLHENTHFKRVHLENGVLFLLREIFESLNKSIPGHEMNITSEVGSKHTTAHWK